MRIILLAALALVITGCASSGPLISNAQLAEFQNGKTTRDMVVSRFGKPSFHSDNLDGTITSAYLQPGRRGDAAAMMSLVTALASNSSPNANSIIFRFDSSGRLLDYERTRELQPDNTAAVSGSVGAAGTSVTSGTAVAAEPVARPAPPPRPARADNLPDWLPSTSTKDPRSH
jgi:hypothetical protein